MPCSSEPNHWREIPGKDVNGELGYSIDVVAPDFIRTSSFTLSDGRNLGRQTRSSNTLNPKALAGTVKKPFVLKMRRL